MGRGGGNESNRERTGIGRVKKKIQEKEEELNSGGSRPMAPTAVPAFQRESTVHL